MGSGRAGAGAGAAGARASGAGLASHNRQAEVERQLGVRFTKSPLDQTDVTVLIDVHKLNAPLSRTSGHGSSHATPEGVARFERFLADARINGTPIHQTRVTLDSKGQPVIEDGRHRFASFRDRGATTLPISVPRSQAAEFRKRFGAD